MILIPAPWPGASWWLDDVLWMDFALAFFNEALRSPNHKTCFSFALGCIQNFHFIIHFCPFGPVSTQPHQNGQAWCKSSGHLRAKLKHVLWLGDLKASLRNSPEKLNYKTLLSILDYLDTCFISHVRNCGKVFLQNLTKSSILVVLSRIFLKV